MYGRGDTLTTGNHIPGNQYYDDEEVGSGHTYEEHKYASQLQVLYEARGRKIESLQKESEEREESYAKEMRILNHRLILATGKHDSQLICSVLNTCKICTQTLGIEWNLNPRPFVFFH